MWWWIRRKITCQCGETMLAKNDEKLFAKVRRHVDDKHPHLGYSDQDIRNMIAEKAEDA
jgi:hypothetical protein